MPPLIAIGNLILDSTYLRGQVNDLQARHPQPHVSPDQLREIANYLGPTPAVELAGGAAGNVARIAAELGCHATVVGFLGSDAVAHQYRRKMEEARVELQTLPVNGPSGQSVSVVANPALWVYPGPESRESDHSRLAELAAHTVARERFGLVYLDGYLARVPGLLRRIASAVDGPTIALDLANSYLVTKRWEELRDVLSGTPHILFATEAELRALEVTSAESRPAAPPGTATEDPIDTVRSLFDHSRTLRTVIVKHAPSGGSIFTRERVHSYSGPEMPIVDPTGSGDAFAATYLIAQASGLSPRDAARLAHQTGGSCAAQLGVQIDPGVRDSIRTRLPH